MKETDIKYLAGLLDADGSFFFNFTNNYVYLTIALDLSNSIDKDFKYTYWLCDELKVIPNITNRNDKWAPQAKITISRRGTLEQLVPRLLKYLTIKGKHLDTLFNKWKECRGVKFNDDEISELKGFVILSRKNVGPIRIKSWLPKAYVAGYIDGDGCYTFRTKCGKYNVSTVSHKNDRIVQDLLFKQYGGVIRTDQDGYIRWSHTLGVTQRSFAIPFLQDMVNHSRLKKHKIEQFLHYHSQRLNKKRATA